MNALFSNNGLRFAISLNHQICVIHSEDSTAKTFVLKSLQGAQFNGYSYTYYSWNNYKTIDWYGGALYKRINIVVMDDADLYIESILRVLSTVKSILIIVTNRSNASLILRSSVKAKSYHVTLENALFTVKACPAICCYCGQVFDSTQLTIEHIIPKKFCDTYLPGAAIKEHRHNKIMTCFPCNRSKSDDLWIPNYTRVGWMRYMTPEQVGGYSKIFVELLQAKKEEVIYWIYVKNMQSHVKHRIDYVMARSIIEKELEFFLRRYLDRSPGDWWVMV